MRGKGDCRGNCRAGAWGEINEGAKAEFAFRQRRMCAARLLAKNREKEKCNERNEEE